jgi:predicted nucleic acid-binding protein
VATFTVVLDACVLIPASVRSTLLRAAVAGLYRPQWSEDILAEVQRNLATLTSRQRAEQTVGWLRATIEEAMVEGHTSFIPAMPIEHDRHVLAAAVASGAQVIVTFNLRHFPADRLAPLGVEAQSPDEFLRHLLDLAPDVMVDLLRDQAAALISPPLTVDDILDTLARHVPEFVDLVRQKLSVTDLGSGLG